MRVTRRDEIINSNTRHSKGDTKPLFEAINKSDNIYSILSTIKGPFAFILLDKINYKIYFGRDTYGRRSLLIGYVNNRLLLTSVACKTDFKMIELPALGVYSIDLISNSITSINLHPWESANQNFQQKIHELQQFLTVPIHFECDPSENNFIYIIPLDEELLILKQIETRSPANTFDLIMKNKNWNTNLIKLNGLLENAIKRRIENQPKFCKNCLQTKQTSCSHSSIGILFSGGLDCAILTLLAEKFIDPSKSIDLMNVAFDKNNRNFDTPDRQTARQTLEELQKLRPNRKWRLLEINISQDELMTERQNHICHLIFPLKSILDESLGCALWFAARGKIDDYVSPCRVLLVGMGADELFGGYTRHRAAFKRGEWYELTKELDTDWKNISHRNLARDDRVVSDHGRQLRTPYLDEDMVEFVKKLNAWERCYPSDKIMQGLGDKLLLRTLAYYLGLTKAAVLRKRALQFGSRIANSKENAHEPSPRL